MNTLNGRLGALRHSQYRKYWFGSFASVGATQLQVMAQGWLIFQLTGSALMLGYLGAAASIPAIVMTLFGGALADRLDKRRLMMTTSLVVAGLLFILGILDASEKVRAYHVIAIAGIISFTSGFDWPTRQAIFPSLIDKKDMMSAVALNSIIWQSCRMIMPAFGGLIIAFSDTATVFFLCSFGFLIMFLVVLTLKVHTPPQIVHGSTLNQVTEGVKFIAENRIFFLLISLSYAGMFFTNAHMQLMPAFSQLLQTGEAGYGYLISATGVGSVVGTILVGSFQHSNRIGSIMLAAAACSGICIYGFCLTTALSDHLVFAYALALLSVFGAAMCISVFMICSMTMLQLQVPDHLRGRVMGLHGITYSLTPLGGLFAGIIASYSSPPVAIAVGATIYLAIVAKIALTESELRSIGEEATPDQSNKELKTGA